jgi:hypothetical protein
MKLVSILITSILLTGCTTAVPLTAKFPQAPAVLLEPCEELQLLADDSKLSDVTKTVIINYTTYQDCAMRYDWWIEWYNKQKQIFEKATQ